MRTALLPALLLLLLAACGNPQETSTTPEEAGPRVYFAAPADGATVTSPVTVEMVAEGIAVAPAGTFEPNTGHFHIVIDQEYVPAGMVVPADSAHIHYGDGATTAQLDLSPGEHTLRLQMADGAHIALDGLQAEIRVTVE